MKHSFAGLRCVQRRPGVDKLLTSGFLRVSLGERLLGR